MSPNAEKRISDRGVEFIAGFEGFVPHPYRDAVGVWTIGFGHTAGVSSRSKNLTRHEALALLERDLNRTYSPPVRRLSMPLTQDSFDALVSVVYNLGPGVIGRGHTLGDALAHHDFHGAADAILLYDKAGGHALAGLTRRRHAERALFLKAGPKR
jgi:lysozyme